MAVLQGSVKNSKGTPLPMASLSCSPRSMSNDYRSFSSEIQNLNDKAFRIVADKDGLFKTWFIPVPLSSYELTAIWVAGKDYRSVETLKVGMESIIDAEVTIDAPDPGKRGKNKE